MYKTGIKSLAFIILATLLAGNVRAEEPLPDKFRLVIGGYNNTRPDANLSVTDPDAGVGVAIDPRDAFDLDLEVTVLRIEGYYRFNDRHAFTYGWYSTNTDGDKTVESEIDWVDDDGNNITIPVGASLESSLDTDIYKLGYLWSFYRTDKMEVGVGGGLHYTRVEIGLDTNITNPPNSTVNRIESDLPLPVFSVVMNYRVTNNFGWFLKSEVFGLEFDSITGNYRDTIFGVEYRAWKHVGLGLAVTSNRLDLEDDTSDYKLKYENSSTGYMFYLASYL